MLLVDGVHHLEILEPSLKIVSIIIYFSCWMMSYSNYFLILCPCIIKARMCHCDGIRRVSSGTFHCLPAG